MDIVLKAKSLFFDWIEKFWSDPYNLRNHVPLVEEQIRKCLKKEPNANELVCLLWWRLHDVWHYPIPTDIDHAIRGADIARQFLQENWVDEKIIEQVVHCVRSHRCKDIQPETIEAKIVAFSDSASHMLDIIYIWVAKDFRPKEALEKLERDYRDLWLIPELKWDFEWLYNSWKSLLVEYEKVINRNENR
jgi:hypothetical protein